MPNRLDGVLVVDKPQGPTSSDVVQKVRRALGLERVGHTGTLDPLATGVLPLCLDAATSLAEHLTGQSKRYQATLRLGVRTETGDAEGRVLDTREPPALDRPAVEVALQRLAERRDQVPPMTSAIKVKGERLYALARRGLSIERERRPIEIHSLMLEALDGPLLTFSVQCSKGTYVRVLGEDLAELLGSVGHLTALRRLSSGQFTLEGSVPLEALVAGGLPLAREKLVSMEAALGEMARAVLTPEETVGISFGRKPKRKLGTVPGPLALVDGEGRLLALGRVDAEEQLQLTRVLAAAGKTA